jgi:hypothetical protein
MCVSYPDDAAVWTVPLSLSLRDAGWQEAAVRRQYPHAPARTVCASEITVSGVEVHDPGQPEAVIRYPLGATYQVRLAETVVSHHVLRPGWSWETHAQPQVGTRSCELYHRGVVLRGRMGARTDEGEELIGGPSQVFDLPPGHVTWVEGDDSWLWSTGRAARGTKCNRARARA